MCLVKGTERRRYVIVARTGSSWESRVERGQPGVERCLLSREQAQRRKAEMELEVATSLGAGWTLESNR